MKRIVSVIFAFFLVAVCGLAGGVLLTGCGNKNDSNLSQEKNNIQTNATIPSRTQFYINANGDSNYPVTMTCPTYNAGEVALTNYGYGFSVNSRGYMESQNKGVSSSYAMLKISFNTYNNAPFTIRYISYGESNFDYAIFSNIDSALSESSSADSSYYKSTKGESSPIEKSVIYSNLSNRAHYIYVKFLKDGSVNSYNDSLQLFFESGVNKSSTTQAWKYQFVGMMYGTLPTVTRPSHNFVGWKNSAGEYITPYSIYDGGTITAEWTGSHISSSNIYFDENYSGQTVNLLNRKTMFVEKSYCLTETGTADRQRWTSQAVSGNTYSYFKIYRVQNYNYDDLQGVSRTTPGILTDTITKTEADCRLVIGFNGDTQDATISFDLSSLQNGTYTISAELFSFSASSTGGTFGNIKIEKSSSYTSYTNESNDVYVSGAYNYNQNLPTPTRTGYTFNGWYRKKNYLDMNAMMNYVNSFSPGEPVRNLGLGVYSWAGSSAYIGNSGSGDTYRVYNPGGFVSGATYRVSYMSKNPRGDLNPTTALIPYKSNGINGVDRIGDEIYARVGNWIRISYTFVVPSDFGGFSFPWYYGDRSEFKNIWVERVDAEDFETQVFSTSLQPYMSDHTLYARWTTNSYTVSFNANGGTGTMSNRTWAYDSWYSVSNGFSRAGYTFSGWQINANSYVTHYYGSSTSSYNTTTNATWTYNNTGTSYFKNLRSASGNVTFYAQWSPNTYTVAFNANGGSVSPSSKSVTYGSTYGSLPTPTRENYAFSGWKRDVYLDNDQVFETTNSHFVWLRDVGVNLQEGTRYHLSFDLRLTSGESSWSESYLFVNYRTQATLHNAGESVLRNATTSWQKYECDFTFVNNNGMIDALYDKDVLHIYLTGDPNRQIKNLVILEDNTSTTSSSSMDLSYNHTLYAQWTPVAVSVNVYLRVISKNGSTVTASTAGGTVKVEGYQISGATSNFVTLTTGQTSTSSLYSVHQGQTFRLTATANSGYVFVGVTTGSTPSPTAPVNNVVSYNPYSSTTKTFNYYVFFKQVSGNQLKYDETDKYFYFEDGYYPQSRATNEAILNSSARENGETITYNNGTSDVSLPVYTYGSDRFVKVTKNGTSAWFKFDPIRWRISDYGVAKTERNISRYTTLLKFRNYTSYATDFVAVSDLILGVGAMNNTRAMKEGDSVTDMTGFQNIQNTTDGCTISFPFAKSGNVIKVNNYSTYSQNNTVTTGTTAYSSPLRIASLEEINTVGLANKQARASDMVAFILGLDKDQVAYWTRDLSNLGSGVAVTASGTVTRPWLDQMNGMRFAYTFTEGSNKDFYG